MDSSLLSYLFERYFNQKATREEKNRLLDWIDQQEDSAALKRLMDNAWDSLPDGGVVFTEQQSEEMLRHILEKSRRASKKPAITAASGRRARLKPVAMALAVLGLLIVAYYFLQHEKGLKTPARQAIAAKNDVKPGSNKATLTLANGATILLDSVHTGTLAQQGKSKVVNAAGGQLVYHAQKREDNSAGKIAYNTLTTPRGGAYQITLPDGSKVWLNAASSLKYPAAFTGGNRKVELTGEAYFEIARDASKPFYVSIPAGKPDQFITVQVLGTHFNVNAYQDEPSIKTTLLEGAVKISHQQESKILRPDEQANIKRDTKQIAVAHVNPENIIAWKNGLFYFVDDDLGTIMRKIERWYDVSVHYENGIPPGHYTGIISRNTNLSAVLKMLELSGLHFRLVDKQIIVTA